MSNLQKGICIPDLLFLYRLRKSSCTHQIYRNQDVVSLEVYNSIINNINKNSIILKQQVEKKILYYSWKIIIYYLSQNDLIIDYDIYEKCRQNFFSYLSCAIRSYPCKLIQLFLGKNIIMYFFYLKRKKLNKLVINTSSEFD